MAGRAQWVAGFRAAAASGEALGTSRAVAGASTTQLGEMKPRAPAPRRPDQPLSARGSHHQGQVCLEKAHSAS